MKRTCFTVLLCCLILPGLIMAQGTTSAAFNGLVTDSDGNPIVGATVTAVHTPTGTVYTAVSRQDGYYNIPAVKVGGPYTVKVAIEPFITQQLQGITLKLGEDRNLKFKMTLEIIQEQVTVMATNPIISEGRTGAAQNVSTSIIESMPSIGRSFDDFARLAPQVDSRGSGAFSSAGKSTKYNNIQIDGAVNNDLFGLSGSGAPGLTTPISIDAVQEFQLVIAPYDVRQGGFTGASLNAITRSGANMFSGSAYYFFRNQDFVGKGYQEVAYGTFSDQQYGFRLGGPVIKDKLFFFVNGEIGNNVSPVAYVIDDSGASDDFGGADITVADAQRFRDIMVNKYGYDPGPFGRGFRDVANDNGKIFARLDYNISPKHRLTLRHNYVKGTSDRTPSAARSGVFPFGDVFYVMNNKTNSTVLQFNSTLGKDLFNELTLNYTTIRDLRSVGDDIFPQVKVFVGLNAFTAGTEQYSPANSLDQDIIEITDNLTWYTGKHTFTIGTHNELFDFSNVYIRNYYGYWEFSNLSNFEIGKPSLYAHDFYAANPKEKWAAKFGVKQLGGYIGDNWTVLPNVTLTLGLRLDVPLISDIPAENAIVEQIFGIKTNQAASGNLLFSPRLGFNWDVFKNKKTQVRGGIGIFSGRTPYVWISNQYSNTGLEFTRYYVTSPSFDFVPDAENQPESGYAQLKPGISEVDIINKDFTYPQVLRTNVAVDHELPFGIIGTLEVIYSRNLNDILYQNLNLRETGLIGIGGRIRYARDYDTFTTGTKYFNDVIYLTNSTQGYQYNLSVQLQKSFNKNSWANFTYSYGESKDVNSGNSSQASSNFAFNPARFDVNDPELTWSMYDVRHRIGAAVSYSINFIKRAPTSIGVFYGGRSGLPYSTTYVKGDPNGDSAPGNDLVYVPNVFGDVIFTDKNGAIMADQLTTWRLFDAFIRRDAGLNAARGSIVERNASRLPWQHNLDARLAQDIPIPILKDNRLQITLDIVNVLNLINKDWGKSYYVSNQNDTAWEFKGYDSVTGKEKIFFTDRLEKFAISNLGSRWGAQLGLRYSFN